MHVDIDFAFVGLLLAIELRTRLLKTGGSCREVRSYLVGG